MTPQAKKRKRSSTEDSVDRNEEPPSVRRSERSSAKKVATGSYREVDEQDDGDVEGADESASADDDEDFGQSSLAPPKTIIYSSDILLHSRRIWQPKGTR